ncbi:MAG: cytochrome b5 [Proteobacteria bacterium]|nr:cytochrome b5 [Pseudomonadota bacterium]
MNKIIALSVFFAASSAFAAEPQKAYTLEEVAKHNQRADCWFVVNDKVYDVTKVIPNHGGGEKPILNNCGKEATKAFETQGGHGKHSAKARGFLDGTQVGILKK